MAWFLGQSIVALALAVLLGLLVGWLLWGRRRVTVTREEILGDLARRHEQELVEREERLARCDRELGSRSRELRERTEALTTCGGELAETRRWLDERDAELAAARARVAELEAIGGAAPAVEETVEAEVPLVEAEVVTADQAAPVPASPPVEAEIVTEDATDAGPAADAGLDGDTPAGDADGGADAGSSTDGGADAGSSTDGGADVVAEAESVAAQAATDQLERIEGVGPKMGAALRAAGLGTFVAVADADEQQLRDAIVAAGLRFAPSLPTWSRQARLLADGDEVGFTALRARLVAGRDIG